MKANVIFYVGEKHPLYNKPVLAEIISNECGYDGRQTYATTIEQVHYPADEKGIFCFKGDRFIGYKEKPAYDEIYSGYCEIVNI